MVVGGGTHRENLNPIPIFWVDKVTVTLQFTVSDALGSAKLNARLNSSRHGLLRRSVLSIPLALVTVSVRCNTLCIEHIIEFSYLLFHIISLFIKKVNQMHGQNICN